MMTVFMFGRIAMENAVYWNGRQVGIECAGRILWFASAPAQALAASGAARQQPIAGGDTVVARNLAMPRSYDPLDSRPGWL